MSQEISARIALLDNPIVDCHRLPLGRVDDLEIEIDEGAPRVTALLVGAEALGERIDGVLGKAMAATASRMRGGEGGLPRIEVTRIRKLQPLIELDVELDELPHIAGLEHWLAAHFVERLPGSGDASE